MKLNWLEKLIVKRLVNSLAKEIEMRGWKTKLGGIAVILSGLAYAINGLLTNDFTAMLQGFAAAGGGLGAIGLGHKVDKNTEAIKSSGRSTELTG